MYTKLIRLSPGGISCEQCHGEQLAEIIITTRRQQRYSDGAHGAGHASARFWAPLGESDVRASSIACTIWMIHTFASKEKKETFGVHKTLVNIVSSDLDPQWQIHSTVNKNIYTHTHTHICMHVYISMYNSGMLTFDSDFKCAGLCTRLAEHTIH